MVGAALLAGCAAPAHTNTGTSAATPTQKLQAAAVSIDKNCQVGVPFLKSLQAVQTDPGAINVMAKINDDAGKVCAVAALVAHPVAGLPVPTLDLASVKAFADSQIPTVLDYVVKSSLTPGQKTAAELAITGAQAALNLAVVNAQ
jgi:hypothetical protein